MDGIVIGFFFENFVCCLMCRWLNVYQISKIMLFNVHKRDYYLHGKITLYECMKLLSLHTALLTQAKFGTAQLHTSYVHSQNVHVHKKLVSE